MRNLKVSVGVNTKIRLGNTKATNSKSIPHPDPHFSTIGGPEAVPRGTLNKAPHDWSCWAAAHDIERTATWRMLGTKTKGTRFAKRQRVGLNIIEAGPVSN